MRTIQDLDSLWESGVPQELRDSSFLDQITLFEENLVGYTLRVYVQGVGLPGRKVWVPCGAGCCGSGCHFCDNRGGEEVNVHHRILTSVSGYMCGQVGRPSDLLVSVARDAAQNYAKKTYPLWGRYPLITHFKNEFCGRKEIFQRNISKVHAAGNAAAEEMKQRLHL